MDAAAEIVAGLAVDADADLAGYIAGRHPWDADFGPGLRAVDVGSFDGGAVRVFRPFQAEADSLISRERLRVHPRGESIRSAGLDKRDVADAVEIDVAAAVEDQAQRAFAGMSFFCVEGRLHAERGRRENPGETAAADAGLEAAVPNQR